MPTKIKITKEMLISAAFDIVREEGFERLSTRVLAEKVGCSTQPIFSNFSNFEELCKVVIELAHEKYLDTINEVISQNKYPEYKASGIAYVKFASEEKNLFKLLFMNESAKKYLSGEKSWSDSVEYIKDNITLSKAKAELFHLEMWTVVHGLAVMCVTSYCDISEDLVSVILSDVYNGLKSRVEVKND